MKVISNLEIESSLDAEILRALSYMTNSYGLGMAYLIGRKLVSTSGELYYLPTKIYPEGNQFITIKRVKTGEIGSLPINYKVYITRLSIVDSDIYIALRNKGWSP